MHLLPLTEGIGSRAGVRAKEFEFSDVDPLSRAPAAEVSEGYAAARSLADEVDMSGVEEAAVRKCDDGESLDARGVRLAAERCDDEDEAVAPGRREPLKMEEPVLLRELVESTVPGISPAGESLSSG